MEITDFPDASLEIFLMVLTPVLHAYRIIVDASDKFGGALIEKQQRANVPMDREAPMEVHESYNGKYKTVKVKNIV